MALANDAKRQLRALTRGADVLGWRLAADLCEEQGDTEQAAQWRLRADVLEVLTGLVGLSSGEEGQAAVNEGEGEMIWRGCPRLVFVWARPKGQRFATQWNVARKSLEGSPERLARYLRQKAMEIAEDIQRRQAHLRTLPPTVSVRQAQEAAMILGPERTDEIVGPGGLSGASAQALARLVSEAMP